MLKYLIQGFLLGLAYVAPIGMQNLYVINTALSKGKSKAYQVALITSFFDISLALACFWGIGALMEKSRTLKLGILLIGSVAVICIGLQLISSKPDKKREIDVNKSMVEIIMTCFMVTWFNPQALIDGSLLLGGFRVSLPYESSRLFIFGVCLASLSWFAGIATITSIFKHNFNTRVIKTINVICGGIVVYYGLKLGWSFLQMIN
jgi:L-lysine exporter family protein LysE/ArgO